MIGSSKNSRENYPRKCFWTQEKETRVKFNPGLSANRPSNNWALHFIPLPVVPFALKDSCFVRLRNQPTFHDATTGSPAKWCLSWWRVNNQTSVALLIGWKIASSYQKHYPHLGSDTSSVWNFWNLSSDVISRGKQWLHRVMLVAFPGFCFVTGEGGWGGGGTPYDGLYGELPPE